MTFKTGVWGTQAKERSQKRKRYFKTHCKHLDCTYHSLGYLGELEALEILGDSIRVSEKDFDLLWGNKRVEVKTSSFHATKDGFKGWRFSVKKQIGRCDFFLLICKDEINKTFIVFLIPSNQIQKDHISLSLSRVDQFSKFILKGGDIDADIDRQWQEAAGAGSETEGDRQRDHRLSDPHH